MLSFLLYTFSYSHINFQFFPDTPPTHIYVCRFILTYTQIRESLNKFPDFFRMGTFIDSTQMKL